VLEWLLVEVEKMPVETPLTKGIRKIASRLDRDNAPPEQPKSSDAIAATGETAAKDESSGAVPSKLPSDRSLASEPSAPPYGKK
jgi:hypothetical protein